MPPTKNIVRDRTVADLIERLNKRHSALKDTIEKMLNSWGLRTTIDDPDETLVEVLDIKPNVLTDMPVESLFAYQWALSKFALFLATQENKLKIEYAYDLKPLFDDLIKSEMIKIKIAGTAEERRARVLSANPKLNELSMMLEISKAYSEILSGLADRVVDMKNVLNRIIDKKALDYKFSRGKDVSFSVK